ncbi:MAG: hypothetical protein KBA40_00620 [Candidatus Peribacteraceae bacterium]|nr:hypothetical protein [Candidatus Peribacteraceae bacterium]
MTAETKEAILTDERMTEPPADTLRVDDGVYDITEIKAYCDRIRSEIATHHLVDVSV